MSSFYNHLYFSLSLHSGGQSQNKVAALHPIEQSGSYWNRSSELLFVGVEPTQVTACD